MSNGFYRAFEDAWRGHREQIKARLRVYLPFLQQLPSRYAGLPVLDVGCGRGEWLELLAEQGITAYGIDQDPGMLEAANPRLDVRQTEALAHLRSLPDKSLSAISAFHVAEHLEFADLDTLMQEARRLLVPDGLLILETPNPENLVVGTASFYIDPTHRRPIPQQLLTFLLEYNGFAKCKLLRLQEPPDIAANDQPGISDVLFAVSPDYGVVALQPGGAGANALPPAFAQEYGVALHELAGRFDTSLQERLRRMSITVLKAQTTADRSLAAVDQLQLLLRKTRELARHQLDEAQRLLEANDRLQTRLAQSDEQATRMRSELMQAWQQTQAAEARTAALMESNSWRLTRPLRWITQALRAMLSHK